MHTWSEADEIALQELERRKKAFREEKYQEELNATIGSILDEIKDSPAVMTKSYIQDDLSYGREETRVFKFFSENWISCELTVRRFVPT